MEYNDRKPLVGNQIYVSPTGSLLGAGTINDPVTFGVAAAYLSDKAEGGYTVIFQDGIYEYDSIGFGVPGVVNSNTYIAQSGSRPIIIGTDGYVPAVSVAPTTVLQNIWFGGTKLETGSGGRAVTIDHDVTVEGCTFFNYGQCILPQFDDIIQKNRFVNCGYTGYMHDIYISFSGSPANIQVLEDIHVGGQGYKIHLFHNPEYVTIHANFMAGSSVSDLAVQQGNHTVTNNILWDAQVSYWNAGNCVVNKNIIGIDREPFQISGSGNTADGNVFCNGQTTFGTNPQTWNAAAIASNLGHTKAEIDTAVSNLTTKFTQTSAQIYADATIETDFAVLRAVIDAWKTQ